MQRTNIIELKPNKKQEKILKECLLLSSCVYNSANYIVRQQFFAKEKVSNFRELQQKMQNTDDYKLLGRSYSLPRLQIYGETNSSRFKLIKSKSQKRVGLPQYYKNRKTNTTIPSYLVIDNSQYSINKNKVTIPLSRAMRKKYDVKHFDINYNGTLKHKGLQKRGQIHYKNHKFYLYQSVEIETPIIKQNKVVAGIDLGIKNLITLYVNNEQEKIIGSKRFFKEWSYITNLISEEQIELSKINRKSSNKLKKLFDIRQKYQHNLFNNIVAKTFRFLNKNNVSKLVIGDIKNIRENNDICKIVNQMVHNYWSFDILLKKLQNKAEEYGIEIIMTTEEYTSRTCPICFDNSKKNCQDRIFVCSFCGYTDHRDIIGARNIMIKGMQDQYNIRSLQGNEIIPLIGCSNATN
jgi:putative transposase